MRKQRQRLQITRDTPHAQEDQGGLPTCLELPEGGGKAPRDSGAWAETGGNSRASVAA